MKEELEDLIKLKREEIEKVVKEADNLFLTLFNMQQANLRRTTETEKEWKEIMRKIKDAFAEFRKVDLHKLELQKQLKIFEKRYYEI